MKATEYVDIYFDDFDLMGILHNARYAVLIERAIAAYWIRLGFPLDSSRALLAVAEFTITYRVPVSRVGPIGVEFWVERLGRSSCVYGYRVVSADGETADLTDGAVASADLVPIWSDCLDGGKLTVWCFGHAPHSMDFTDSGVRFVCNPRGHPCQGATGPYSIHLIDTSVLTDDMWRD